MSSFLRTTSCVLLLSGCTVGKREATPYKSWRLSFSAPKIHNLDRGSAMKLHWIMILTALLTACNESKSTMTNGPATVEVTLHTPIAEVIDRSTTKFNQERMKKLELCWYKIDKSASDKDLPDALIKNATNTLTLKKVTNITIVIDDKNWQQCRKHRHHPKGPS